MNVWSLFLELMNRTEFWRNSSPRVTVNFLIDYCESFMQVSNNLKLKTGKWTTWSGNKLFHLDNFPMIDWLLSECVPRQTAQEAARRVGKIQNVFNISTKIESDKIWSQLGYPGFSRPPLFSPRIGLLLLGWASEPTGERAKTKYTVTSFSFHSEFLPKSCDWIIPVDLLLIAPVYFGPGCPGEPSNYFAI